MSSLKEGTTSWYLSRCEVLPLQDRGREDLADGGDELVHQRPVVLASQPWSVVAQIERVGQEVLVVGADVE